MILNTCLIKLEIQGELKDRCGLVTVEEFKSCDEPPSELDEKVLIVGGYDGSMWLSAVDSYSPSYDLMESLSPMNFARSSAAAAKLNGEVYLLGGVYGECWNDTGNSGDFFFQAYHFVQLVALFTNQ